MPKYTVITAGPHGTTWQRDLGLEVGYQFNGGLVGWGRDDLVSPVQTGSILSRAQTALSGERVVPANAKFGSLVSLDAEPGSVLWTGYKTGVWPEGWVRGLDAWAWAVRAYRPGACVGVYGIPWGDLRTPPTDATIAAAKEVLDLSTIDCAFISLYIRPEWKVYEAKMLAARTITSAQMVSGEKPVIPFLSIAERGVPGKLAPPELIAAVVGVVDTLCEEAIIWQDGSHANNAAWYDAQRPEMLLSIKDEQ